MDNTHATLIVIIASQLLIAATCYYAGMVHGKTALEERADNVLAAIGGRR